MKKLLTTTLAICLSFSVLLAQKYHPATLQMKDGSVREALMEFPPSHHKYFFVKSNEDAKKEKISEAEVEKVEFPDSENGSVYEFARVHSVRMGRVSKNPYWMLKVEDGPASLYLVGSSMMTGGANFHKVTDMSYYVMREGEKGATWIGTEFVSGAIGLGVDKQFRKYSSEYFSDRPDLVERIQNKEWEINQALELIKEYNKLISSK